MWIVTIGTVHSGVIMERRMERSRFGCGMTFDTQLLFRVLQHIAVRIMASLAVNRMGPIHLV